MAEDRHMDQCRLHFERYINRDPCLKSLNICSYFGYRPCEACQTMLICKVCWNGAFSKIHYAFEWNETDGIFFPNFNFFHFYKNFIFSSWRLSNAADDCLSIYSICIGFTIFILTTQTIKCLFNYLDFNIALYLYVPSYIFFLKAATFV